MRRNSVEIVSRPWLVRTGYYQTGTITSFNRRFSIAILLLDLPFLFTVTWSLAIRCAALFPLRASLLASSLFSCSTHTYTSKEGAPTGVFPRLRCLFAGVPQPCEAKFELRETCFPLLGFTHVRSRFSVQAPLVLLA